MRYLLWDASALAKRYVPEPGDACVHALWTSPNVRMVSTFVGYAEVVSIMLRKRNDGKISPATFSNANSILYRDVVGGFELAPVDDSTFLRSVPYILAHNINSVDAALLACFVGFRAQRQQATGSFVIVSADGRFIRAAASEGFATINPEILSAADVASFLSSLP